MIGFSTRLGDFAEVNADSSDDGSRDSQTSHEDRLSVYEEGYQAGWDDAIRANDSEVKKLRLLLIETLETHRTDFDSVYMDIFEAVETALSKILVSHSEVLISETISSLLDDCGSADGQTECVINTSPNLRGQVERIAMEVEDVPVSVNLDASLREDEVVIQIGEKGQGVRTNAIGDILRQTYKQLRERKSDIQESA